MRNALLWTVVMAVSAWHHAAIAQEGPATREALLDALGALWVQHNRQPTPEEIDAGGPYKSDLYLREWQSWEGVRQALAEHLYQKGALASIQGNTEKAAGFYRQCLMVDPQHVNARNGLAEAISLDLDAAAKRRTEFLPEKAGPEASAAFYAFLVAYGDGRKGEAERHYKQAVALREAYIESEIDRLNALYAEAVTAFDRKEYAKAVRQFEELRTLKPAQPGYTQVYQLHAGEIDSYITRAQTLSAEKRTDSILTATRAAHFAIWASGSYYALPSLVGLKVKSGHLFKVSTGSFFGGDIGVLGKVRSFIYAGTQVSMMMNSPKGQTASIFYDSGSILGISGFVQPGGFVADQIRLYGQTGATWYRIRFPEGTDRDGNPETFPYSASTTGFFFGGGMDLFTQAIGKAVWGLKFDLKYHIAETAEQNPTKEKLKLNGLRLGMGLVLAR
jgi:tetratricopeptide (TPR) repeat protein